jgi:hypothetical protein
MMFKKYIYALQEAYLKQAEQFGIDIPLEILEQHLRDITDDYTMPEIVEKVMKNKKIRNNIKFKLAPKQSTAYKNYVVHENIYTSIIITSDLVG